MKNILFSLLMTMVVLPVTTFSFGCNTVKDSVLTIQMNLVDNMDGGTNKEVLIDVIKESGTIYQTVNGLDPEYSKKNEPYPLPVETIHAIIQHVNAEELSQLKTTYVGAENSHLTSNITITTQKKIYEIKVTGNSANDYIRKLHQMAYDINF